MVPLIEAVNDEIIEELRQMRPAEMNTPIKKHRTLKNVFVKRVNEIEKEKI